LFITNSLKFYVRINVLTPGIEETNNWTLEEYKKVIYELQGKDIQIVESTEESKSLILLSAALKVARMNS